MTSAKRRLSAGGANRPFRFDAAREILPWLGPLISVLALVAIIAIRPVVPLPNPGVILLLTVAISAVLGGVPAAMASAGIAVLFAAVDGSIPGQLFKYEADQAARFIVTAIAAPAMAVLVGGIKGALDRETERTVSRQSEERHRALTETATDAIIVIDTGSTIRAANPAAEQMFGYPLRELVGGSLTRLMPEALRDRHRVAVRAYLASGVKTIPWQGIELTARHASGREFPVEISFGEHGEGPDRRLTGIIRDITQRKELESQLLQAQKMDAIGQLAGGVAHDFNNLLTAISGYADLLAEDLRGTEHAEAVGAIRQAAGQAAGLTSQLLAFSRRQALRPSLLDLNATVRKVEPLLRRLIGEHLELVVREGPALGPVLADPAQIETVILNLATNARDAMAGGGSLTIETANAELDNEYVRDHVEVLPGHYVMVAVTDTGSGIGPDVLPRVFEPFFTTKSVGAGTGLGLATVHGIVKQSGGHVWVYTEPGRGTTFKVYLPRAQATIGPEDEPANATDRRSAPADATILVVEDDASVRSLISTILERRGYRVILAPDRHAARQAIETAAPAVDLLITDVVMPGGSGPELADEVATIRPDLPILYISGYTSAALRSQGVQPEPMLDKPFRPEALLDAVNSLLEGRAIV